MIAIAITSGISLLYNPEANTLSVFLSSKGFPIRAIRYHPKTTSGNSPNVLKAVQTASSLGMRTVGLTGATGGAMAPLCDVCIKAPSTDTPTVQECHAAAGHTICLLAEQILVALG